VSARSDRPVGRSERAALVLYAAIFLEGLLVAATGPALDALSDQTGSTTGQIGLLFTASGLGYVIGSTIAGRLYGRLDGNVVIAATLVVMAVLTASIPLLGSLPLLLVVFTANGAAMGLVDVGGNTLIGWIFGSAVAPHMNTLHLSFGMGAFLSPLVIDRVAVWTGDAASAFWLFAISMVPIALWASRLRSPRRPMTEGGPSGALVIRRNLFLVAVIAVMFIMHVGAEVAFAGWIFSYAEELAIGGTTTARVLNSVFWGGLVVGRLIAIPLSRRLTPRAMLWLDLAGCGASLAAIALLRDWPPGLWIGTICFGMSIASVFPTCLNYTSRRIPLNPAVTSLFIVGAGIGSMSLPWVTGLVFESRGPESLIPMVGAAVVLTAALLIVADARSRHFDRSAARQ